MDGSIEREEQTITNTGGEVASVETNIVTNSREAQEKAHKEWLERQKQEWGGLRAQHVRKLAGSFLRQLDADGYQGYAIVGIPNKLLRGSQLYVHLKDCNWCDLEMSEWCDDGMDALTEDRSHDNVLVMKSAGAGDYEDYSGLTYELSGEGRESVYDLLSDAELISTELTTEIPTDPEPTENVSEPGYTPEFWKAAYALVDAQQKCEICKQYRNLKTRPYVDVRVVLTGDGTPNPECLRLLCKRCYPDPKANPESKAA